MSVWSAAHRCAFRALRPLSPGARAARPAETQDAAGAADRVQCPGVVFPDGPLHAVGHYEAPVLVMGLPRAHVQAWLPRALSLDAQDLMPEREHPVMFLLGRHRHVRPSFLHDTGGSYWEFVTAIPYLRHSCRGSAYSAPFAYMPRLYLSSWLFVVLGWFYGYAKCRGRIRGDAAAYSVRSLLAAKPLVSARFLETGRAGPALDFPHFRRLAGAFRQPFVGKLAVTPYLCSILDFQLERATLQPLTAELRIETPFLPGLPAEARWPQGIDAAPLGAFRISMPWTLSPPLPCCELQPAPTGTRTGS
ncbi:MAG: hypothetical protein EYC70_09550 [Planctomycetota bacterium]|nr:MAG: hypothetical protein EYC70_09550 [Planctomycetota bacterium]